VYVYMWHRCDANTVLSMFRGEGLTMQDDASCELLLA
jgi:hypothetical protein